MRAGPRLGRTPWFEEFPWLSPFLRRGAPAPGEFPPVLLLEFQALKG